MLFCCCFFYLQAEWDSDQHPAGGHDTVAGPEQRPPACVLDEQTLEEEQEECRSAVFQHVA